MTFSPALQLASLPPPPQANLDAAEAARLRAQNALVRDFLDYYIGIHPSDALPARVAFDPTAIPRLLPNLVLAEVVRQPEVALAAPEHWPDSNDSLEDIQVLIGPPQRPVATRGTAPATAAPIRVAPVLIRPGNPLAPTSYPKAAIANGLEGDVLLGIELDRNSQIRQIRVVRSSGHATLDAAAIQSARTWKLRVHTEDYSGPGRILSVWIEAPVSFRLN